MCNSQGCKISDSKDLRNDDDQSVDSVILINSDSESEEGQNAVKLGGKPQEEALSGGGSFSSFSLISESKSERELLLNKENVQQKDGAYMAQKEEQKSMSGIQAPLGPSYIVLSESNTNLSVANSMSNQGSERPETSEEELSGGDSATGKLLAPPEPRAGPISRARVNSIEIDQIV